MEKYCLFDVITLDEVVCPIIVIHRHTSSPYTTVCYMPESSLNQSCNLVKCRLIVCSELRVTSSYTCLFQYAPRKTDYNALTWEFISSKAYHLIGLRMSETSIKCSKNINEIYLASCATRAFRLSTSKMHQVPQFLAALWQGSHSQWVWVVADSKPCGRHTNPQVINKLGASSVVPSWGMVLERWA